MTDAPPSTRDRILRAATDLLAEGGREAVSTRAVSAAAGVQAPTIYRTFGDMRGLLDSVAAAAFQAAVLEHERRPRPVDTVEALRAGWDLQVGYGLAHPDLHALMYTERGDGSEATRLAEAVLLDLVRAVAEAGRLTVDVDRAARMLHAGALGVTLALVATPEPERDAELSARSREAILDSVTTHEPGATDPAARAVVAHTVALATALPGLDGFSDAERALLGEWLARIAR